MLQDKSDESIRDRGDRGKLNASAQQMLTELLRHVTMEKPQIRVRMTMHSTRTCKCVPLAHRKSYHISLCSPCHVRD